MDDTVWQEYYKDLVTYTPSHYTLPKTAIGQRFLDTLAKLLHGIVDRHHNSEKFLIFVLVILQRDHQYTKSQDINRVITDRLDQWDKGDYRSLVQQTTRHMQYYLHHHRGNQTMDEIHNHFQSLVNKGEIRTACRYISERETSSVLQPDETDARHPERTVETSLQMLHPEPDPLHRDTTHFPDYNHTTLPDLVPVCISDDIVKEVAARLGGCAGLGGTDSTSESASCRLRADR